VSSLDLVIEENMGLVNFIAQTYLHTGIPLDDLISMGSIGLIKAVRNYKEDYQAKLSTFAGRCIHNEIKMYLRSSRHQKEFSEVSLNQPLYVDEKGHEFTWMDLIKEKEDEMIYENDEYTTLRQALNMLSDRDRTLLELRFGLGTTDKKTQFEIAESFNVSQSYVSRLEQLALKRLRIRFKRAEYGGGRNLNISLSQ
jgi:RNA polymerase sporulation-specific sigma factor